MLFFVFMARRIRIKEQGEKTVHGYQFTVHGTRDKEQGTRRLTVDSSQFTGKGEKTVDSSQFTEKTVIISFACGGIIV